jgi:phosphoribosyl 1,2-cyclic phosphodiesterase
MAGPRVRASSAGSQLALFGPSPAGGASSGAPPLRFCVLGSGSSGNAVVVDCGGRRILIDAGFGGREVVRRLRAVGVEPETLGAIVLTHEHGDHIRGVDQLARRFSLPVLATPGTLAGMTLSPAARLLTRPMRTGGRHEVAGFEVEPFAIPHDAREPVGLVVRDAHGRSVGLAADLGMRSRLAWGRLRDVDALILEANHDVEMLRRGPYPWALKQRVAGSHGHLSNAEAALGIEELVSDRLRTVVLYHLSRTNNLPALALAAAGEQLARLASPAELVLSFQHQSTAWLAVQQSLPFAPV